MATPTIEQGNVIVFDTADQETIVKFRIRAIVWESDQATNKDIAANDDMLLEAGDGTRIIGKRAIGTEGLVVSFPGEGVVVIGMKAEDLDGGILQVYGERL